MNRDESTTDAPDFRAIARNLDGEFFAANADLTEYARPQIPHEFGPFTPPPGEPVRVRVFDGGVHGRQCGPCVAMDAGGVGYVGLMEI